MRTIYKIAKTELQTLFYSPVAWLVIVIFIFQTGMTFTNMIDGLVRNQSLGYEVTAVTANTFANPWGGVFPAIQGYLFLYIPLLTMGLMSREFGSGSIKLLYSSPVTNIQIILGKFLSMMIYGLVLIALVLIFVIFGALLYVSRIICDFLSISLCFRSNSSLVTLSGIVL